MHMRRPFPVVVAGIATLSCVLSGCGGGGGQTSDSASGTPRAGGDLVMVRAADVTSLLPTAVTQNLDIWAQENIFDTLLVPTKDGKGVAPSLATDYKESGDHLSWTFHLRKDVKFSDGTPMTSKDVKWSLETASDPKTPFGFINAPIKKIDAPDPYTVIVHTKQPWSPIPADMALFSNSVVPAGYGGKSAAEFADHPVGTGPFKLDTWTKGQDLKLVKNPNYWQSGRPYLNSVDFNVVPSDNTRALQVQGGQAQINEFPAYSSVKSLQKSPTVKVGLFGSSRVDYLTMNNKHAPFTDVHVRRAISYAIDRQALIKDVLYGNGTVANSYLTPALWGHDATLKGISYDMTKAKQELAQSSTPNGFSTTITIPAGNADDSAMAQIIQNSLATLNIKVEIRQADPSAVTTAEHSGNFDMTFTYCTTDIIDPDEIIRFVADFNGGANSIYSQYDNPESSKMMDQAAQISDQEKRKALYDKVQEQYDADQPAAPLYYTPSVYSWASNVHGFTTLPTGNYTLSDTWLSE
jgi:peptide/nickel transport system substrate-binding protein